MKVLVEKHDAYEDLTDEDQDPVLLWDEYIRRGEEQRQQAELIMGWTMSFQDVSVPVCIQSKYGYPNISCICSIIVYKVIR